MAAHGAGKPSTAFRIPAPPLTPPHSNPLAPTWTTVANPPPTPPVSRTGTGTVSRSATGTVLPLPPLTTAPRANTDPYAPEYTTPAPAAPATAGGLPPGYAAQILPGRYLRYQVIDAYVKQHPGASFGSAPLLRLLVRHVY